MIEQRDRSSQVLHIMHAGSLPDERTMAMVFLPVKPNALGDVFPYFFRETCVMTANVSGQIRMISIITIASGCVACPATS